MKSSLQNSGINHSRRSCDGERVTPKFVSPFVSSRARAYRYQRNGGNRDSAVVRSKSARLRAALHPRTKTGNR
ncbi:MAG: hypothetical protein IT380_11825 [Myxococcales bacterium]|nr:hypothetical protein [Myxococcales bacterium]